METADDPTKGSSGTRLTAACLGTVRQPGSDHQVVRIDYNVGKKAFPEQGPKAFCSFCRFLGAGADLKRSLGCSSEGE